MHPVEVGEAFVCFSWREREKKSRNNTTPASTGVGGILIKIPTHSQLAQVNKGRSAKFVAHFSELLRTQ